MERSGVAVAIEALDGADLALVDSAGCADLLHDVKVVRGWLDAAEARITARMTELHDTAGAAPAADMHTRCAGVSAADAKRKERRSKTLDDTPEFGDALANGQIGAEHVDALANATSELDADVTASLFDETSELLDAATSMSPERFARHVRDRARRLEPDNGVERDTRQRCDTFLSRKLNLHTGMIEGRYAFHPYDRCEIHHITPWEHHGPTDLHNMIPHCHDTTTSSTNTDGHSPSNPTAHSPSINRMQRCSPTPDPTSPNTPEPATTNDEPQRDARRPNPESAYPRQASAALDQTVAERISRSPAGPAISRGTFGAPAETRPVPFPGRRARPPIQSLAGRGSRPAAR